LERLNRQTVLLGKHEYVRKFAYVFGIEGDPEDQARAALVDPDPERAVHRMARQSDIRILEGKYRAKRVPSAFERVSVEHKR
jgi:hypothetical protein